MLVGPDLSSVGGGTKAGVPIPTLGQSSESEEKLLRLRLKQLICDSLNGQTLLQPYIPRDRSAGSLGGPAAGSWS